jgi:hypothetical protein
MLKFSAILNPRMKTPPEHDGANKGDGCIRGNNAHFADPGTQQGHREISVVMSLPAQLPKLAKRSRPKKSAMLHYYRLFTACRRRQHG